MTIVVSNDPRIMAVEVTDDLITAHLAEGGFAVRVPCQFRTSPDAAVDGGTAARRGSVAPSGVGGGAAPAANPSMAFDV